MGNSLMGSSAPDHGVAVHTFYSPRAWIDARAEDQLNQIAGLAGMEAIAAFPDLHPGKYGPVGCAALSANLHPQLVGNDIGCGMSLFQLDLTPRKIRLDKAEARLRVLGDAPDMGAADRLEQAGTGWAAR